MTTLEDIRYASCSVNTEAKTSRADTWLDAIKQPAPITVLCQNDEDVP